jgi:hypothetical protein
MNKKSTNVEFTNDHRAVVVNAALDGAGVVSWGRATTVAADCEVSHATASGWLLGSLPRDSKALLRFCDKYDIDVHHWINGKSRGDGLSLEKIQRLTNKLKDWERKSDDTLSPYKFSKLLVMLYEDESKTDFLLENVSLFLD